MIKNIATLVLAGALLTGCGHPSQYNQQSMYDDGPQYHDNTGHVLGAAAAGAAAGYLLGHHNANRGYYQRPTYGYGYPVQHVVVHHVYHHYYHHR
jgi:hypothetical protein